MSRAITFDTLAFAKKIESSGLASKHAESIAEAIRDVFEENLTTSIFTKEDGKLLEAQLRSDMFKLKSEMIIWIVGLLFAQTTIIVSIIKFIH